MPPFLPASPGVCLLMVAPGLLLLAGFFPGSVIGAAPHRGAGLLTALAPLVAEHEPQTHRLSCSAAHGIFPDQGPNRVPSLSSVFPAGGPGGCLLESGFGWSVAGPSSLTRVVLQQARVSSGDFAQTPCFCASLSYFSSLGGGRNLVTSLFQIKNNY